MLSGPIIWVEGLIGAGKSRFVTKLSNLLSLRPLFEPVDGNPYLADFYKDPKTHAFPMQIELMARRHNMQRLALAEAMTLGGYSGAILDRGLPGDRVFCKLHMLAGNISEREWDTYQLLYEIMTVEMPSPSLLIYLDVEPETALERVQKRARSAEVTITLDYLKDLKKGYLDLLSEIESGIHSWSRGISVKRLPYNTDYLPLDSLAEEIRHTYRL
jgi:deoxyadenosine/deoxycytidine kinase